ncbi:unnamed protein product [Callosobruchus maculatus]|uniref:AMP-dependent synthetase/ligase domain-containing protein n=1 Tax=Callosobruchus maculatus TaxID=64391 RepID=A0A653C772_CALMS|nr:unnamed protein product [Callosobruchus maculatus]
MLVTAGIVTLLLIYLILRNILHLKNIPKPKATLFWRHLTTFTERSAEMLHDNIIRTREVPLSPEYFGGVGYVLYNNLKRKRDHYITINGRTGEVETASSLLTKCIRTSLLLRKHGIKKGDVVIAFFNIQLNSCVPCIASYFIGAIPSFMDPGINEQEVIHQIKLCQPKIIITYQDATEMLLRVLDTIGLDIDIDIIVLEKEKEFLEPQIEEESFKPVFVEDLQQTAAIFFSSGSTGYPKAICLSHYSIFDEVLLKGIPSTEEKPMVILGYDNYYWLVETWKLIGLVKGHGIRVISPKFDTEEVWRMIDKYKVTMLFFDVKETKELCESRRPSNVNVYSVSALCVVGDRLPVRYQRAFKEMFPAAEIPVIYGLTETGICTHFCYGDRRHLELIERHPESIGVPVEGTGVSLKVVDLETGEALGPNRPGELCVKTRNLLNCYYKTQNSDHFDSDGWFRTGDVLRYDEDLRFYFEGRIKDIIVFQGWHVAPGILETKLKSHPAVKRAAVVGKPHPPDGEHPMAIVELAEGRDNVELMEIKEFVDEDMNDLYKLRGGIVAVKKLPITITGKVKKGLLRKMMEGRMVISATEDASDFFSQRS